MSNAPDILTEFGGAPVTPRYNGMWGNKNWFVDWDGGTAGGVGDSPDQAQKYVDTILAKATAWDTIYIRPRTPDMTGGDPQAYTPVAAANLSISATQYGLALIGTGLGCTSVEQAYQTRLQGDATVTTTPVLKVLAPYVTLENLTLKPGAATTWPLVTFLGSITGAISFGGSVYNCRLHMATGTTGDKAAVQIDSNHYTVVKNCYFDRCSVGVGFSSTYAVPVGCRITNNIFECVTGSNYGDIVVQGTAVYRINIDWNNFNHAIPGLGAARYIFAQGSSTGSVSNNVFATATVVTATIVTLSGILDGGGNMTNRGWLTS